MFLSKLFAKISHNETSKIFKKFVIKTEIDGIPSIFIRKNHNFNIYTTKVENQTIVALDATINGYTVKFSFIYSSANKLVACHVTFPELNLSAKAKYKQMIIDNHKSFTFDFNSNTEPPSTTIKYEGAIKRKEDIDTFLQNFRREWNTSGLYKLMIDLRKSNIR